MVRAIDVPTVAPERRAGAAGRVAGCLPLARVGAQHFGDRRSQHVGRILGALADGSGYKRTASRLSSETLTCAQSARALCGAELESLSCSAKKGAPRTTANGNVLQRRS
jgi:hypothetical protein